MGLDDLVDTGESTKTKKTKKETTTTPDTPDPRGYLDDPDNYPEMSVREKRADIQCVSCSSCSSGTSVPVFGYDPHGSLYRCTNLFCDKHPFNTDEGRGEGDLMELWDDMLEAAEEDDIKTGSTYEGKEEKPEDDESSPDSLDHWL